MNYIDKNVVVTGGTGALGAAVVDGLLKAGATCTVPYVHDAEMAHFAHKDDAKVSLIKVADLSDESDVAKLFQGLAQVFQIVEEVADNDQQAATLERGGDLVEDGRETRFLPRLHTVERRGNPLERHLVGRWIDAFANVCVEGDEPDGVSL